MGALSGFMKGISDTRSNWNAAGDEAVENSKAIGAKRQMMKEALGNPDAKPVGLTPRGPASLVDRVQGGRFGSRRGEKRIDTKDMMRPLGAIPSYKKGGKIKKTGIIKAHKGERVLTTKQTKNLDGLAKGLSK